MNFESVGQHLGQTTVIRTLETVVTKIVSWQNGTVQGCIGITDGGLILGLDESCLAYGFIGERKIASRLRKKGIPEAVISELLKVKAVHNVEPESKEQEL